MKRWVETLFLVVMMASILIADEEVSSPSDKQRTITIGTKQDFPPYSFRGEDGLPCGYSIDVAQAIARVTGLKIQIRVGPSDQLRQALEAGDIDVIAGINYSEKREKQLDFTLPFTILHHAVFSRNDTPGVSSEEKLKGKKLIVVRGDIMHDYVVEHGLCLDPIVAMTQSDALRQLSDGQGDYALIAEFPGIYWIQQLHLTNLQLVGPLFAPTKYCFAVKNDNIELLSRLNKGLANIKETGEQHQIYEKWFRILEEEYPHKHYFLRHILIIVLPLFVLLALTVTWLWTTRIQVRRATAKLREEIAERKKAEDEINQLARFPSENPNPVLRIKQDGQILYANKSAEMLLHTWGCRVGDIMPDHCFQCIQHAMNIGHPEHGECDAGERTYAMSIAPMPEEGYANLYGMDITDRRIAAEKLQKEIQRHKALMDVSLDGIAIINQDHQIIEANHCFADMLGYTMEEVLNLHTWDWQADVTEAEIRSAYVDLTRAHSRFETHHRRKDGTVFPVEVSLSGTSIGGENMVYTVTRDITKRKQSEKALRESEAKYRTLIEQASDAVFLHDRNGKILDVNRKACENLGYTREELLNMPIQDIDREAAALGKINSNTWSRVLAGEQIRFESHQTRKDGSVFPVEVTLGAVNLPIGRGVLGIARDITERKQAETEIRRQRDFFRIVIDSVPAIICVKDRQGRYTLANHALCNAYGTDIETLEGQLDSENIRVKNELEAIQQADRRVFETRSTVCLPQTPITYADGSLHWFYLLKRPLIDADGSCNDLLTVAIDISERVGVMEELKKLNSELEQRVAQRTGELEKRVNEVEQLNRAMLNLSDDLRKTNRSLEETAHGLESANQELEAFSYSVSHDLRSPLRAMDGFSQAVLEDYSSQLDDTGKDYLRRIRAAAQHMAKLIDAILELSRATRVGMTSQQVDLSALAIQVVDELRQLESDRQVDVVIAPKMVCRGDENLLRQLLANLLGNAWKFTAPRQQAWIEFTVLRPEEAEAIHRTGQTVYVVRDNGVGFDMHYASKLFNAFQRLHSREEFPGTGVGLATVKRIISRHGGEVWAESVIHQGASIYFTLGTS